MEGLVFLDRDGVINKFPGRFKYVCSQNEFRFLPRSIKAINLLTKAGFSIYVVSNQAGVSKRLYSNETLSKITKNMLSKITQGGGKVKKVFYCTHTKYDNCNCRKPKTGLIDSIIKSHKSKNRVKYFIGDSIKDVQTGKNSGCKTVLVLSGREKMLNKNNWKEKPDLIARDLYDAVKIILKEGEK